MASRTPRSAVADLRDIPNVGPATVRDFKVLGITRPRQLIGRDGLKLYRELQRRTGHPHDPCCADVFLASVAYMEGAPARPWWSYTKLRKKLLAGADRPKPRKPASRSRAPR